MKTDHSPIFAQMFADTVKVSSSSKEPMEDQNRFLPIIYHVLFFLRVFGVSQFYISETKLEYN